MNILRIAAATLAVALSALRACFQHTFEICAGRAAWHRITPSASSIVVLCMLFLAASSGYYLSQATQAGLPTGALAALTKAVIYGLILATFLRELQVIMAALMISVALDTTI